MALVLVCFAVTVVFVISLGFVAPQNVAVQVSKNIANRMQARMIAESGAEMTIAYMRNNFDWRAEKINGVWAQDCPYADGTFTVVAVDGEDTDGDGTVEGDGDLFDDPLDPMTLMVTGVFRGAVYTVRARIHMPPTEVVGSMAIGAYIRVGEASVIDSFDSFLGHYSSANSGRDAFVATNATDSGKVCLEDASKIRGNVYVGPGGDPDAVIEMRGGCRISGTRKALDEPVPIAPVDPPVGMGASQGDLTCSGTVTISENLHVDSLVVDGGTLRISGDVTIYAEEGFRASGGAHIELLPRATLNLYVSGPVDLQRGTRINMDTGDPKRVKFFQMSDSDVTVDQGSRVYANIFAPNARTQVLDGSVIFGTYSGHELYIGSGSKFHQDIRGTYSSWGQGEGGLQVRWY